MQEKICRPPCGSVKIEDRFWTPYLSRIRKKTIPYVMQKFEECGYLQNYVSVTKHNAPNEAIPACKLVAPLSLELDQRYNALIDRHLASERKQYEEMERANRFSPDIKYNGERHYAQPFSDGLVLETVRGISDFLANRPDDQLRAHLDEWADLIATASEATPDGYLSTYTMQVCPGWRWGDNGGDLVRQHDLYNHGALVEAGISYYLATGETRLLACAVRAANMICALIGHAPKRCLIPGHSLPEEAFIKLYRLFRDHRELDALAQKWHVDTSEYLRVAKFWYDERGNFDRRVYTNRRTPKYSQDHLPFAEQREAVGHAVRAGLCYTGAAALVYENGDQAYMEALDALFSNITEKKLHISGGIGTRHDIEGFDEDYLLPQDAYLETCAAIAFAFFCGEMALLRTDGAYYDYFERSLYNNILAAISENGEEYFYENPLISDGSKTRWGWHDTPCCPPMLLKIFSSLGSYIYTYNEHTLSLNLHIGSSLTNDYFSVSQRDKAITLDSHGKPLTLRIRVPEYAKNFALTLNGESLDLPVESGYVSISRIWSPDDRLCVTFDEPIRRIASNPKAEANRGQVAFMRGAYLLCAEGFDNDGNVDFTVASDPALTADGDGAKGLTADGRTFRLIPYYRRCNRTPVRKNDGQMRVWFRQESMPDLPSGSNLYFEI